MKTYGRILLLIGILIAAPLAAQDTSPSEETTPNTDAQSVVDSSESDHEQLRALREALTEAVLRGDVDTQIKYVDDDVVTTWQNNQVARGHDGLKNFMEEMNAGNQKVFQGYTTRPTSDDISVLHGGNTAIAFGKSVPHYKLLGMEFDLENRWTATLVKKDGNWKIAAYHVSANMLDNPVLGAAENSVKWVAGLSLLIGLVLGAVGAKLLGKKREPAA